LLSKKKIDAIYSTDYKRTKATAQPTATNHGLSIEDMIQRPSHILKYRKTYIDSRPFNTALEIIEAAGGTKTFTTIADEEYDNLFLVTIKKKWYCKSSSNEIWY
jgi:hypothetical protein